MDELSDRERELIDRIRDTKNPKREITYLISVRDRLLPLYKPQPLLPPAPRAAS